MKKTIPFAYIFAISHLVLETVTAALCQITLLISVQEFLFDCLISSSVQDIFENSVYVLQQEVSQPLQLPLVIPSLSRS